MLTKRIANLAPSKTMVFTSKARALKEQGFSVMDFTVGEPDFQTPANICEAGKRAIDEGHTKYTAVNGIAPLREAIAKKLLEENGISYTPEQICVGTGAKQPLFNAVFAICEEGDEIIIPTPSWVSYEEMVKLAGATPVFVACRKEDNFDLNVDAIAAAVTPHTKGIIINTPNNPTGAVYSEDTLRKLGELAIEKNFFVITDEVYEKLVYGDAKHVSIASLSEEIKEHCILINGMSKSFAMTGWRIGYVAACDEVIKAVKGIQSHTTSSGCSVTQYAGLEAYLGDRTSVQIMHDAFLQRREYLVKRINAIQGLSCNSAPGAFYIMMDISALFGKKIAGRVVDGSNTFADILLDEAHVALVPGDAFHADEYMRFCYAQSMDNIKEGMDRIEKLLKGI